MITECTVHGMILSCSTPAAHGAIATWLKDFGPIICSVASFWLAYRVSRITREQKEINKSAYNLNLFKERFAVYGKFKTLSDDKNIIYDNIPYNYLKEATVEEVVEYLKKLYRVIDEIFILFKDCEAINTYLHDRKDNFLKLATSLQKRKKIEYFLPEIDSIRGKTKLIRSSMREGYYKYESYHYIYSHINIIIKIISKNDVEDFYIKDNYTFLVELAEKMAIIDTRVYDLFISGEDQVFKKMSDLTENENKNVMIINENIDNLILILDYIYDFFSKRRYSNDYYIKGFPISKDFFDILIKLMEKSLIILQPRNETLLQKIEKKIRK